MLVPVMTETDAERIHREVEERLGQAEKAVSPIDLQWLRMVKEWTRPAKDVQQRQ